MRSFLLSLILSAALASTAQGAIALGSSGTSHTGISATNTATFSTMTIANVANRCLFVAIQLNGSFDSTPDVNWDVDGTPQPATQIANIANINTRLRVFQLIAPTAGNLKLTATWMTNRTGDMTAISFDGLNQSTCRTVANDNSATPTTQTPTLALSNTVANGWTVAFLTVPTPRTIDSTDTATSYIRNNTTWPSAISYEIAPTNPFSHTWTLDASTAQISIFGITLIPYVDPGSSNGRRGCMLLLTC